MITKKQKVLEKKLKHQQTKTYIKEQTKKVLNKLDKEWREKVKVEFNNQCIICKINNGNEYINKKGKVIKAKLACHHLIPRELAIFRHEILNGVLLCASCHKYSLECSAHKNSFAFYIWYIKNYNERYLKLVTLFNGYKCIN